VIGKAPGLAATLSEPAVVRFGVFELDLRRRELRRKGALVKLHQQPYEILALLVRHRGELVSRELIQQTLWPDGHFVDFERGINTAIRKLRRALCESASAPAYVETTPRVGYRLIAQVVEQPAEARIETIAVLPLKDLSNDPEAQFFVDGLTDALITEIGRQSDLRVVSDTAARGYRNSQKTVREIAAELEIQAIVEGSVLRLGNRIRISARLLDAVRERHLWAQTYDRDLRDILSLQQELVTAIAGAASHSVRQGRQPAPAKEIDPRAYESFLRGNFLVSLRVPKSLAKAAEYYQAAMALEPDWAPPYAGLAEAGRIQAFAGTPSYADVVERTKALTGRALSLDPSHVQAHATLGAVIAMYLWKWEEGEDRIQLALENNPRSAQVEHLYSTVLLAQGRYEQALQHIDAALAIEHSSLFLRSHRAQVLLFARRYEESIHESEDFLSEHSGFAMGLLNYGAALMLAGRSCDALPALERAYAMSPIPAVLPAMGEAYLAMGQKAEVKNVVERLKQADREAGVPPTVMAMGSLLIDETEAALGWMEKAFHQHDIWLLLLHQLPLFDQLRNNPRATVILGSIYPGRVVS
jgi:TolB-like protein/thioredoxin-like negative regulator of GroEL